MGSTDEKVRYVQESKSTDHHTPITAAEGVEEALKILEGRWKLLILFHLFDRKVLRFSDLERSIPAISQKMLIQQLRQLEVDGIVRRIVHHVVPPKVEYCLTKWGQALCPSLDALLKWAALREKLSGSADRRGQGRGAPVLGDRSHPHTDHRKHGAGGGSRTHTGQRPEGF